MSNSAQHNSGIGCFTVLGLIFVTLKLTGNIDWSWKWVLAPFWGPIALVIVILGTMFAAAAISEARKAR